jgi:hypothetical protein
VTQPGGQREEWTMICPPGWMDDAVLMCEYMRENVREIIESDVALDHFILINDSQTDRFWEHFKATPIRSLDPIDRYWLLITPVVHDPPALARITGI